MVFFFTFHFLFFSCRFLVFFDYFTPFLLSQFNWCTCCVQNFLFKYHDIILQMIIFIDYASCTYVLFLLSGINLEDNIKQFPFEYSIQHNFARPKHFRGSNTMYFRKRSSFFFLLSPNIDSLKIVTNHPDLKPIAIFSSSAKPNFNFLIARFVSGILKFLNWVNQPCKDKIFSTVRRYLLSQFTALKARQHSSASNLNQTKTYFRFSYKRQTIYFSFYLPCMSQSSCVTPCCFITKS